MIVGGVGRGTQGGWGQGVLLGGWDGRMPCGPSYEVEEWRTPNGGGFLNKRGTTEGMGLGGSTPLPNVCVGGGGRGGFESNAVFV